jgi:hypothetical protein
LVFEIKDEVVENWLTNTLVSGLVGWIFKIKEINSKNSKQQSEDNLMP